MQITIRPDPDCIELIRAEFKDMVIGFLKSVGIPAKDAENWETIHTVEINEIEPPLVDVFEITCFLPAELFTKPEWVFEFGKEKYCTSFVISWHVVCFKIRKTDGLKYLHKNLVNIYCHGFEVETLNEHFQELKNLPRLKSISFKDCTKLKDISLLENLVNLQSMDLGFCLELVDISSLSGLVNLQVLDLHFCRSLTDISSLFGLISLKTLNLHDCCSVTDISGLSNLVNLKTLNLRNCRSVTNISGLSNLVNLKTLNLKDCDSPTDISDLSGLVNLQTLDLGGFAFIKDISSLSGLIKLQSLHLDYFRSLTDISCLSGLIKLQSLILHRCTNLININGLSGLVNLQTLYIQNCNSLTDISSLSGLVNMQTLDLSRCNSLTDISSLSGLVNMQTLDLSRCNSLTDIICLDGLINLKKLNLEYCVSLTDISGISALVNLQTLYLQNCKSLTDISSLSGLVKLQSLSLENCKRIQNFSPLRKCLALKEINESNMHPVESAELLCFLAVQRKDIPFISEKANSWLQELKLGLGQNHSSANDLACSLAQGLIMANLDEVGLSFHQTLLNNLNVGITPWKSWFSENLKAFGWDKIQKLAESNQSRELTFGAIAGISSCLPSLDGDPAQIAWAKKWISEIHSLHNNNHNFLKPAAAEWCLALKRIGEDELLREWIEKFTDPSDPSALDPINKVFSAYALDLNDSESALEYAFKINDPKLRDESILNLAQQFIQEGETSKAGDFLFLLTQIESRTQLAYSLAEDAAYLKIDENVHRLLAACGDNPQSLASILDKLRLANPASEILKFMHDNLGGEKDLKISGNQKMQFINLIGNSVLNINDSDRFAKIQKRIVSELNSN